jgi:non-specific serine/threonine protein kinase
MGPANAPNARPTVLRPRRLVGRDSEIRDVTESIASAPLTTLTGPGGVGKTALAMAVAVACTRDFPDGVTVVWLGSLRSAELVAAEVAAQLGLPRSGGQSYEDALTHWLTERDVLLLIDNCEHVLSAVADLVDGLTARLPRLRVLATSREPLWIDGEVTYRLAPLSVVGPDASLDEVAASTAVQLFRERAGARARGALDTERACRLFAEICRRVDGLPLAIELAAARVAGLDPEDIASHLDDLFTLLPQPARRADGAQRSLRATVEWSDALLTEEERRLLHRMGAFAGRFDLGAIKEVCAIDGQTAARVADLTARLVEKSLLLKLDDSGGYQLLETIRQYSIEQLTAAGELDVVRERHARFYLGVALQECAGLMTGTERPHLDVLARIDDNVRVALARLLLIEPRAALELSAGLLPYWWIAKPSGSTESVLPIWTRSSTTPKPSMTWRDTRIAAPSARRSSRSSRGRRASAASRGRPARQRRGRAST